MKNIRRVLFTLGLFIIIGAICATCFIFGRGHTIYLDNKSIEDTDISSYNEIVVSYKGEEVAELYARERGVMTCMGQNLKLHLKYQKGKTGEKEEIDIIVKLPYDMDNIVINIPAYLQGADYDTYLTEFVSLIAQEPESEEEEIPDTSDEFSMDSIE